MADAAQFTNTLSASDGGPARHSLEVNFALNNLNIGTQLISIHRSMDSLLEAYHKRSDRPSLSPREGLAQIFGGKTIPVVLRAKVWIFHGYYLGWLPPLAAAGALMRKQMFIMPHGSLTQYDRNKRRAKKRLFHLLFGWWLNRAVKFVVATEREANEVTLLSGVDEARVVGAGATIRSVPPTPTPDDGEIRMLSMSRVAPKKRIDRSIRALAELRSRGARATLTIAGSGDPEIIRALHALSTELKIEQHVEFVGQVEGDAKNQVYEQSDIFLLLSEDENFGIGLADALAMGLPSVVTPAVSAAHGLPDDIVVVTQDGDSASVADAVLMLAKDYSPRRSRAYELALEHFSWLTVARRWQEALGVQPRSSTQSHHK